MTNSNGTCQICGSLATPETYMLREMLFGGRETFEYHRCVGCGVLRIAEPPVDLVRHYPADYYGDRPTTAEPSAAPPGGLVAIADAARDRRLLLGRGRPLARLLRRWATPVSAEVRRQSVISRHAGLTSFDDPILDVGCGRRPTNLLRLRTVGFRRLHGIDPFLEADRLVEGIELLRKTIHEATGTYRLITFHHSFEHVPDPASTLASASRRLAPGGTILIRTPVMGTWFWEHYGTDWWELDAPRHLWLHTRESLERLSAAAGLVVTNVVWDSTFVELIASDQIARDIAWHEPASWNVNPPAGIDDATIAAYRAKAKELNRAGASGRAGFYLRRATGRTGAEST